MDYDMIRFIDRLNRIEDLLQNKNNVYRSKLMTIKDIVRYTGLSDPSIRRNIQRGELKAVKKEGKKLFRRIDVDNWLEG
tara:strand:+ start:325 stop:561 length:237 start_codon:yes stop_codon:yes gene_type:complete